MLPSKEGGGVDEERDFLDNNKTSFNSKDFWKMILPKLWTEEKEEIQVMDCKKKNPPELLLGGWLLKIFVYVLSVGN